MRFAFAKKYRFECQHCGVCCLEKALSLTDSEYKTFTKTVDSSLYENVEDYYISPDIHLYDVSFKGKHCYFVDDLNETKVCRIYNSRFVTCRLFPLSVTALPNGELLVNLIHCNGVSLDHGKLVNESFVRNVLNDVNNWNPSFLPKLIQYRKFYHNNLFPFYTNIDITDFWTKYHFFNRIFRWFTCESLRSKSIHARIRAINEVLSRDLRIRIIKLSNRYGLTQPPMILTQYDVEKMADEIEKGFENKLNKICEEIETRNQKELQKVLSEKKMEILFNGKPKMFGLDEKMTYSTPYLDKIEVKVKDMLVKKPLSDDAIQLFEDYIAEILSRVDRGGFPMNLPIIDILESLYRFSQGILTYAQIYSYENARIEKVHINDAIVYLDTRYALGPIFASIIEELKHART